MGDFNPYKYGGWPDTLRELAKKILTVNMEDKDAVLLEQAADVLDRALEAASGWMPDWGRGTVEAVCGDTMAATEGLKYDPRPLTHGLTSLPKEAMAQRSMTTEQGKFSEKQEIRLRDLEKDVCLLRKILRDRYGVLGV